MATDQRLQEARDALERARAAYEHARKQEDSATREAQQAAAALRRAEAALAAEELVPEGRREETLLGFLREEVKGQRTAMGLRQEDLASRMREVGFRWQRVTVAEVERGSRRVTLDEMVMLAAIFGLPVAWLLVPPSAGAVYLDMDDEVAVLPADDVREMLRGVGSDVDAAGLIAEWEAPERLRAFVRAAASDEGE